MILPKETFKKLMTQLVQIKKYEDNLQDAFKKFDPEFGNISFIRYEQICVDCLKVAMNDINDWIGYWIYELDCGKTAKKHTVTDKDGKDLPIKTLDDLYKIIEDDDEVFNSKSSKKK